MQVQSVNLINNILPVRRKKYFDNLPDKSLVILPNNKVSIRSNDTEYKFRTDSDLYYLTGFEEPNSIAVFKKINGENKFILFIEPKDKEKEIWTGEQIGLEGAKAIYSADEAYSIKEFEDELKKLIQGIDFVYLPFGKDEELDLKTTSLIGKMKQKQRKVPKSPTGILDSRDMIYKMKAIKDSYELDCIKKAANISKAAHLITMLSTKPGMYEYELEALLENNFRKLGGNAPSYSSIVASGNNATVLHYTKNNKKIEENDLVLVDAATEYNYYASDITRTFPASAKFTKPQKELYEIVLKAQEETIKEVKPGTSFNDLHKKSIFIISQGLKDLGLLTGNIDEIIEKKEYLKYYMHNIGHFLGLDTHDAVPYFDSEGNSIKLLPGMVLTVEPGIYISEKLENVPKEYKSIGIRIEDDVLVTNEGNEVLTNGLPKKVSEMELSIFF